MEYNTLKTKLFESSYFAKKTTNVFWKAYDMCLENHVGHTQLQEDDLTQIDAIIETEASAEWHERVVILSRQVMNMIISRRYKSARDLMLELYHNVFGIKTDMADHADIDRQLTDIINSL